MSQDDSESTWTVDSDTFTCQRLNLDEYWLKRVTSDDPIFLKD